MIPQLVKIKQGTTFSLPLRLHPVISGSAMADLTGWTARAQLRRESGDLVDELTATWLDASARILLVSAMAAATAAWPVSRLAFDLAITSPDGALRMASATMAIGVEKAVTK